MPPSAFKSQELVRLNKLVALKGSISSREANYFIGQGWVSVEGLNEEKQRRPGTRLPADTPIEFHADARRILQSAVSLVFNKPLGVLSCQPEFRREASLAIKLLTQENRHQFPRDYKHRAPKNLPKLAVAGRLDIKSTGLLLFTQSGKIAERVIGPTSTIEKEYLVRLAKPIVDGVQVEIEEDDKMERLERLRRGIESGADFLEAENIFWQNDDQLNITLLGGKYHHIRRMCEAVGWQVAALKRVRIGPIRLEDLPLGKWRYLTDPEYDAIRRW